jgi:hypothetical protein
MPTPPPLTRLLLESTFFPGLNVRLGSLHATRKLLEAQIESARLSEIQRVRAEHADLGSELHPDDRESDNFDLEQQVLHLVPKVMRGGFLVTLWSVLERTTHDIAATTARYLNLPFNDRTFHRSFFVAAKDEFSRLTHIEAFPDPIVEQQLRRLQAVRNALVHHDGRQSALPTPYVSMTSAALEQVGLYVVRDYDHVYVLPGDAFLAQGTDLVYAYVHDLAQRVLAVTHPDDA